MTVSISKMSIDYYLQSAMTSDVQANQKPHDMTAYYTETATPPGRWFGSGLAGLGMAEGTEVTRSGAIRLYEHMSHPETGEALGRRMRQSNKTVVGKTPAGRTSVSTRDSVAGFDLTFSAPKSVSTLWALGDYTMQSRIESAHRQAMQETMSWIESNVAQTRAGHGGVAHVPVTGLVGTVFDHWESRDGDPQLHSHAVVSNRVQRVSDGQWVTLDSYTLHRHVVSISETYNSLLFDRLHNELGAVAESRDPHADTSIDAALRAVVNDADVETPDARHRAELAGVPDSLIEEFSSRSVAIETRTDDLVREYVETYGREPTKAIVLQLRQRATLETRAPKSTNDSDAVPLADKKHLWRQRAINAGHDPARIIQQSIGHPSESIRPSMLDSQARSQVAAWALADASQRHPTFTRANVLASSERVMRLVRCDSVEERRELIDGVVDEAMDQAVPLTPRRSVVPSVEDPHSSHRGVSAFDHQRLAGVWTTREMLESESYLIGRYQSQNAPVMDPETLQERLSQLRTGSGHTLSPDQQKASAAVLASGRSIDAVIGPAGTGKTTTMRAVSDVWQQDHGTNSVVALAPSAVAAGVLADDLGVNAENTSKWLYETTEGAGIRAERVQDRTRRLSALEDRAGAKPTPAQSAKMEQLRAQLAQDYAEQARFSLRPGQLVLVDEASMVSTAHMTQLAHQAEKANAKIVMVGDPAQLGSVDAGGFLGYLDRKEDPARLDQAWRFNNSWERHASLGLREGNKDALRAYDEHDRIHGGVDADPVADAYQAWREDRENGKDSILIAPDNETVRELNQRAHTDLVNAGEVDDSLSVTLRGDTSAGAGDVLLARRNDRSIRDSTGAFISNGTRLTLTEVRDDGSAIGYSHSSGGQITLDPEYLSTSTELGYATTAHRSQGVTTDTSHAVANTGLSRELFYVAMTRGREENHAYVFHEPFEEGARDQWDLLHEKAPAEAPMEMLEGVLGRSSAERTATETADDELAWANDLGRLMHEREYLGWAGRSDRTQDWLQKHYPEETVDRIVNSPEWRALTNADPKLTHAGEVQPDDSVKSIIERCTIRLEPDHGPTRIGGHAVPATVGQDDLLADVDARTAAELTSRRATLDADPNPPGWYTRIKDGISDPTHRQEAIDAVMAWRAVSDRDDLPETLGPAPRRGDHLRPYYDRAAASLAPRGQWEPTPEKVQQQQRHAERASDVRKDRLVVPVTVPAGAPEPQPEQPTRRPGPQGPDLGV